MVSHDCSSNTNCSNSVGSFQCNCQSGYTGDGRACQGKCKLVLPLRQMDCYPSQMHNAISTHFEKCWNKPINHDLGRDNERDRQIHRYMYVNRNWKNKSQTGRQEENTTQRNITSDFEIYFLQLNFFDFCKMLTNALWLLTTVLLTLIVQILWDHSSARVEQDILVMAKHVKVRAV